MPRGLVFERGFLESRERGEIAAWLQTIHPVWEPRYGGRALAAGSRQRWLLRPVYWLGSWQFACLDYYRPPKHVHHRCICAEPYPPPLASLVERIEAETRRRFEGIDLPAAWRLSSCLINLYGRRTEASPGSLDAARVGEHRDHEPGPVASISLGDRALFEFVRPGRRRDQAARPVERLWLEDSSLVVFGGELWKQKTLHRVVRVERRRGERFPIAVENFETRRVNLTFRFVPDRHVEPFAELPADARDDVRPSVQELARHSAFWADALRAEERARGARPCASGARATPPTAGRSG